MLSDRRGTVPLGEVAVGVDVNSQGASPVTTSECAAELDNSLSI